MKETIEQLIDANGLSELLVAIETICHEKAAHILESYNDKTLSNKYTKAAAIVLNANYELTQLSI